MLAFISRALNIKYRELFYSLKILLLGHIWNIECFSDCSVTGKMGGFGEGAGLLGFCLN